MQLFALLQAVGGPPSQPISATHILGIAVLVAAVVGAVMLMTINVKLKDIRKTMQQIADLVEKEIKKRETS